MRWQKQPLPRKGDKRIRRRFLLFPKCIDRECRWLERAEWAEEYHVFFDPFWAGWEEVVWCDE